MRSTDEDLSTAARIRTTAFSLFSTHGIRGTTVRAIAEAAGVSAGLVLHHFGSKDGLRAACDDWLHDELMRENAGTMEGDAEAMGQMTSRLAELSPHMGYIVAALSEGGPGADRLFDRVCDMTDTMISEGIRTGTMRAPQDRVAWVTTLTALSCGLSMLGDQVARRLGGATLLDPSVYARHAVASIDLFTHGLFTDERYLDMVRDALHVPEASTAIDASTDEDTP